MRPSVINNLSNIASMQEDEDLKLLRDKLYIAMVNYKYSYNFNWLSRPIIQFPTDIIAMQEIIWEVKPDLIIETGIAHGGSLIFYASMMELLGGQGEVLGVDIDIREHNRIQIEKHKMFKRITMIQGSSVDKRVANEIYDFAKQKRSILVALDSHHDHKHVLEELQLYAPLVTKGSYLVVFDTIVEDLPETLFSDRSWKRGNNPKTAVWEFLSKNDRFEIDKEIESKLLFTSNPDGYLKCIRD